MGGTESLLVSATVRSGEGLRTHQAKIFKHTFRYFWVFHQLIWLIQAHLANKVSRLLIKRDDEDDDHELLSVAPAWC